MSATKQSGSPKISKRDKELYLSLLQTLGEVGLYQKAVGMGMTKAATNLACDKEILDAAESFLLLYRRTGNDDFATISKVLRRTAHSIMRELVKQTGKTPDSRFLILVKV